jgi:hypothetical protein
MVHNMLASITARTDDPSDAATRIYRRALAMARQAGGGYPEATALLGLAEAACRHDRVDEAKRHLTEALALARRNDYHLIEARVCDLLSSVAT